MRSSHRRSSLRSSRPGADSSAPGSSSAEDIEQRQRHLRHGRRGIAREERQSSFDRTGQRPRAAAGASSQHRHRQVRRVGARRARCAPSARSLRARDASRVRRASARRAASMFGARRRGPPSRRVRRKVNSGKPPSRSPIPQSDSNARSSPECGVAVSRTTVRARRASAAAARARSERPVSPCASSNTTRPRAGLRAHA